ncbi:hypothetical protein BDQ12DRAFT_144568 [Crucibulum laeve]|uniref:Uncharacterized protein n=1 Tax=Crucibulum laeve TaxID=68775 RepID=A0A5C3LWL7_9AGAR|nr:hypothetical protein BDQ12DRAFT_144568 [Crucibulum laeve]
MPRVASSDEVFKKAEQVVERPSVTKQNINDEYMRHPPNNLQRPIGSRSETVPGMGEGRREEERVEGGMLGEEASGRQKMTQGLAELAQEDSVHR